MLKVTPIGSCRIAGPLRHGQNAYGIALNLARCYGYCHSPAEAVQMARFLRGSLGIPREIWPLVAPSQSREAVTKHTHRLSDLYVVELSSAKELTVDGVSIQLNYFTSKFRAFFSDTERANLFWACAESEDRSPMTALLRRTWSANEKQRAEAQILEKIHLNMVTLESLRRDIQTLTELLPRILFVTHVDVRKPNGLPIASRSSFIKMVSEEVARAGHTCFDPTRPMAEFGQQASIADHSTSLAHFTTEFTQEVMDDWMQQVIAPMTDNAVCQNSAEDAINALHAQIRAACEHGRYTQACARLERLACETALAGTLLKEARLGQKGAQDAFCERIAAMDAKNERIGKLGDLVSEATNLGLFRTALSLAKKGGGGLAALPTHVLMKAARLAVEAGDKDAAFEFAYGAYCGDRQSSPASDLISELAISGRLGAFAKLKAKDTQLLLSKLKPVQKLLALRIQGMPPRAALSPRTSEGDLSEMIDHLSENEQIDEAVELMAAWRTQRRVDRIREEHLVRKLDAWVEAALVLPVELHRIEALNAIREADPRHRGLRNALQTLKTDLIIRIRAAGKAQDLDAIEKLRAEVGAFPAPLPEFDLWRARLHFGRGEFEQTLDLGQGVASHFPESIGVWVLLMRASVKLRKDTAAAEFARKVMELASAKTRNIKAEAEAVLTAQKVDA